MGGECHMGYKSSETCSSGQRRTDYQIQFGYGYLSSTLNSMVKWKRKWMRGWKGTTLVSNKLTGAYRSWSMYWRVHSTIMGKKECCERRGKEKTIVTWKIRGGYVTTIPINKKGRHVRFRNTGMNKESK